MLDGSSSHAYYIINRIFVKEIITNSNNLRAANAYLLGESREGWRAVIKGMLDTVYQLNASLV